MAWLYVPGLEDSSWEFPSSSPDTELWVMSSGIAMQRPLSWREWKTRPWIQRLYGTICRPSMADRGAEKWISSLPASLASRSVSPEKGSAPKTSDGSGRISSASFGKFSPDGSFLKTSLSLFEEDSGPSSVDWPSSGMMRGGTCSVRRSAEPRISDEGSSFSRNEYPTPAATPYGSSQNEDQVPHKRPTAGTPSLESWSRGWPSPRAEDAESCGNHPGADDSLTGITKEWQTPMGGAGGNISRGHDRKEEPLLEGQAKEWPTPTTMTGGPNSNRENRPEAGGPDLQESAQVWATQGARDWKDSGTLKPRSEGGGGGLRREDGSASPPGDELADPNREGFGGEWIENEPGKQREGWDIADRRYLPLFPPGPEDLQLWAQLLNRTPEVEPAFCGVAYGVASRVDRLRACGNGVVPIQAAYALVSLVEDW